SASQRTASTSARLSKRSRRWSRPASARRPTPRRLRSPECRRRERRGDDMTQRLTGIGVSPGIVAGRAVILIQRAQVLRYQIAGARIETEVARLEQSRTRCRQQLTDIRARVGRRRGPELAALFDAQLLMLDD